jgi:2'-hydroxyisoflavone reductase
MRLLILGGTVFLGRHLVEAALQRGHTVTLFNRGQHNPDLFPPVEKIHGDRDGGLDALHSRQWDAVIDTCGYVPRIVRLSVQLLAGAVKHYTFISTISVYAEPFFPGMDENASLGKLEDESVEQITGETYGPLKALCEQAAEDAMPGRALIVRPGLIVGPHDPSDRFTYWPARLARGGEVLAPGGPQRPVQIIDARDLAEWVLKMVERQVTGVFNATGPDYPLTLGKLFETCQSVAGSQATLTWASDEFLLAQGVAPYTDLPLWLPEEYAAQDMVSIAKTLSAGLKFRPLEQTVRDTLAWDRTRPPDAPRRNCLTAEREAALLQAWKAYE